jgi:thymidine kinase
VGIDEGQFLGPDLLDVCNGLADRGRRVIVAGLDQDYLGRPFEPMPQLLAVAEYITKNLAICVVCGNPADRSQRVVNRDTRFLVGETDAYEARCRLHWDPLNFEPVQERLALGRNLSDG